MKDEDLVIPNIAGVEAEVYTPEPVDQFLILELKVLLADAVAKKTFADTYGSSRTESKNIRSSELGKVWDDTVKDLEIYEKKFKDLERDLNLRLIKGASKIASAESRKALYGEHIRKLEVRKRMFETLGGGEGVVAENNGDETVAGMDLIKSKENTDVVAMERYKQLLKYKEQLKEQKFVWLGSRLDIHADTIAALLNGRWPVLVGEAGTGKSQQADAAAMELTGHKPTEIACSKTTGESDLIGMDNIDPKTGGSYVEYGPLMQAFTGFSDSRQLEPEFKTGRICRLDEFGKLGDKAYAILKKAGQVKAGDDFYGKVVLAGAGIIGATNPPGNRYKERQPADVAMRREFAERWVDYPTMTVAEPELFEFALVSLLDENGHINVAKNELGPAYKHIETTPEERAEESRKLADGSIVLARDEIKEDLADKDHGTLWRFCGAIKALQDSFVHGNSSNDFGYPQHLLRYKENDEGKMYVYTSDDSGNPLTLSESTVTLGEMGSWLSAFNGRRQRKEKEFQVDTLTEWLNLKIAGYIKQAGKDDREKLEAIFNHFGFLDKAKIPDTSKGRPLTQVEIGYLSPLVPRPLELERPINEKPEMPDAPKPEAEGSKEHKMYETKQVVLENGEMVLLKVREFTVHGATFDLESNSYVDKIVRKGQKVRINGVDLVYVGVVEDASSEHNGKTIVKFEKEDLHRVLDEKALDKGMVVYESEMAIEDVEQNITPWVMSTWERACVNNEKNNPEEVSSPEFAQK